MMDSTPTYQEDINQIDNWIITRGGEKLASRLIRPDDKELIIDLGRRLSPESRRRRFHQSVDNLSDKAIDDFAHYLAAVDNYTVGGAVLALTEDEAGEPHIVGVARLGRVPSRPLDPVADAAIVIRDDYQGQGVGSELLRRLVLLARQMKVKQMSAVIESDNKKAIRLFYNLGLPTEMEISYGETTLTIEMPAP